MQKPHPALKSEVTRCQRPNRTDVHHVAGIRIVERPVLERSNRDVVATSEKLHFAGFGHVIEESNAPRAQHTPFLIEHHHGPLGRKPDNRPGG